MIVDNTCAAPLPDVNCNYSSTRVKEISFNFPVLHFASQRTYSIGLSEGTAGEISGDLDGDVKWSPCKSISTIL